MSKDQFGDILSIGKKFRLSITDQYFDTLDENKDGVAQMTELTKWVR